MIYRREIDGLRALAVLPVILFHGDIPGFSGGFVGVDVFFVISGYLITTILLTEMATGNFSLVRFYERRARRILPALYLVLAVCLPVAVLVLLPSRMDNFASGLGSVLIYGSNIFFYRESGYFSDAAALKPLLHTWSLSVEEQFYIVFPLLLLAVHRISRALVPAVILGVFIISFALALWQFGNDPDAAFFLLPARAWELAMGAICALWLLRRPLAQGGWHQDFLAIAGLALIVGAAVTFPGDALASPLGLLLPTLGTALVILNARNGNLAGRLLGQPLLVAVGLISYSAYLWHQPLFAFARHLAPQGPSQGIMLGLSVLTLILAALTHKFVETPFRNPVKVPPRRLVRSALAASLVLFLAGLTIHLGQGFPRLKLAPWQIALMASAEPSPRRDECHADPKNRIPPSEACIYNTGERTVAVFGDSHMVEFAYALAEELEPIGTRVKHLTYSSCGPSFGRQGDGPVAGCVQWTREAVDWLDAHPEIRTVFVGYRLTSSLLKTGGTVAEQAEVAREWISYFDVLRHLDRNGRKIVLVLQAPQPDRHIDILIEAVSETADIVTISRSEWAETMRPIVDRLSDLSPSIEVIDPADILCDRVNCYGSFAGVALYFDGNHPSVSGARLIARQALARLSDRASGPAAWDYRPVLH